MALLTAFIARLTDSFLVWMVISLLPTYVAKVYNAAPTQVALLVRVFCSVLPMHTMAVMALVCTVCDYCVLFYVSVSHYYTC